MSRKSFAVFIFAALAVSVLVLFGQSGDVSATTVKLNYSSNHDCGGADANEATTADNSCVAASGHNVGVTSDVQTVFDIQTGHSNYANTRTILASPAFNIALDPSIPNGAYVGYLTTTATISLLNGPCSSGVPVTIPLYDAATDVTNTIDWTTDGSNLTVDSDSNGLADGIDKYPSFLNVMFSGQKPAARYYGYTNTTAGSPPTQLNFVIFAPGVLQGTASAPGMPRPDQDINASLGFINYVALNNPVLGSQTAPSSISDICSPLNTTTRLFGKTQGEGRSIAAVGNAELSAQCSSALIGADNDGDTVADDGCIVVTDKCADGVVNDGCPAVGAAESGANCNNATDDDLDTFVNDGCPVVGYAGEVGTQCANAVDDEIGDNDGDTKVDEYCVNASGLYAARTRSTNPATNTSGIYGTATHMAGAYLQGYRDADNDGIANEQDSCPTIADGRESGAACADGNVADEDGDTLINDGCQRKGTAETFPTPNQCADALDQDGDTLANDGCPPVQVDGDGDGLGAACDPNDAAALPDQDGDGFQNRQDLCPLIANVNQADTDSNRCNNAANDDAGDDGGNFINDGCPQVGATKESGAQCNAGNVADEDGDTVVNDGCPLKGFISENCVVSSGDWGPCSDAIADACDVGAGAETAGAQCNNALDDDGDAMVNDGCVASGAAETGAQCGNATDDDADTFANDGCPTAGSTVNAVDGDYEKDMPRAAVCIGDTDADSDGWCDTTETLLGSNTASNTSTPEYAGLTYPMPTGAPSVCSDLQWYASGTDPIGDGAAVDNDADTLVNAADPGCNVAAHPTPTMPGPATPQPGEVQKDIVCVGFAGRWFQTLFPPPGDQSTEAWPCDTSGPEPIAVPPNPGKKGSLEEDDLDKSSQDTDINKTVTLAGIATGPTGVACLVGTDDNAPGAGPAVVGPLNEEEPEGYSTEPVAYYDDLTFSIGLPVGADSCDYSLTVVKEAKPTYGPLVGNTTVSIEGSACSDADMDGVFTDCPGKPKDNCPSVYNPDQTNSDTLAIGGGDATGDACDANDDGDGLIDTAEWTRGSDARNPFSPFMLDLDGNGSVTGADASALKAWIGTAVTSVPAVSQVCLP